MDPVLDPESLRYLFSHLFLPPKTPEKSDEDDEEARQSLVDHIIASVRAFSAASQDVNACWAPLIDSLDRFSSLHHARGSLSAHEVEDALKSLGQDQLLFLVIYRQNSGLSIRQESSRYIIETFELQAPNLDVLTSVGPLRWSFPSRAIAIPSSTFADKGFRQALATFLEKASNQDVSQFTAITSTARSNAQEPRGVTEPALVGDLLMGILLSDGVEIPLMSVQKRVRDEVRWADSSERPWRRSVTLLALKVFIQLHLRRQLGAIEGQVAYKYLMVYALAKMVKGFTQHSGLPSADLHFANRVLAWRLFKIENMRLRDHPTQSAVFDKYSQSFTSFLQAVLANSKETLELHWSDIQASVTKKIRPLHRKAFPDDLKFELTHSKPILHDILSLAVHPSRVTAQRPRCGIWSWNMGKTLSTLTAGDNFDADDYLQLMDLECSLLSEAEGIVTANDTETEDLCERLAKLFGIYEQSILPVMNGDPAQTSVSLLSLVELWKHLDIITLREFPLLADYNCGIPVDLLFSIQVFREADFSRIKAAEDYLTRRASSAKRRWAELFDFKTKSSFTVLTFNQDEAMQEIRVRLDATNKKRREAKEAEWRAKLAEYQQKELQASRTSHLYRPHFLNPAVPHHVKSECIRCRLDRECQAMTIEIYEDNLPAEVNMAKAVVIELALPPVFAIWRDITWKLIKLAGGAAGLEIARPKTRLWDYSPYRRHGNRSFGDRMVTLEPSQKTFYSTHNKIVKFPTTLDKVLLPHRGRYQLCDYQAQVWVPTTSPVLSFASLCAEKLLPKSPFASCSQCLQPVINQDRVNENASIAARTKCPPTLLHCEYTAFLALRGAEGTAWLNLLRELRSTNLSFSAPDVGSLVRALVLTAGRRDASSDYRESHRVFSDPSFAQAMLGALYDRAESIKGSWQETNFMESLLIIAIQMFNLVSNPSIRAETVNAIYRMRQITLGWTRELNQLIQSAENEESARSTSLFALHAALLCRKSFTIEPSCHRQAGMCITSSDLATWLETAFIIKENLALNKKGFLTNGDLPQAHTRLILAGLRLVHEMGGVLIEGVRNLAPAIDYAVNAIYEGRPDVTPSGTYSAWELEEYSHHRRITSRWTSNSDPKFSQSIIIDLVDGTLLVDNEPHGRLPAEYTKHPLFRRFFGSQLFKSRKSRLAGMTWQLSLPIQNHHVHLSFRGQELVMRIQPLYDQRVVLEYVPVSTFGASGFGQYSDLPSLLLNDEHTFWLELSSQNPRVFIRPRVQWGPRPNDWILDLKSHTIRRPKQFLINPASRTFRDAAEIIEPFEYRSNMLAYQTEHGYLVLDLPRLQLTFKINSDGFLLARQLNAYVDPNQDAGCLYGFESKLVLRDRTHPDRQTAILGIGKPTIQKIGEHQTVRVKHDGSYALFRINQLLGNLECAIEPGLLYYKAYCHAVTSSHLSDPLTKRTGVEEAIRCLKSGYCQPWRPLDETAKEVLKMIARLTPRRSYYPVGRTEQEKVDWDERLPWVVQDEELGVICARILEQSEKMQRLHPLSGSLSTANVGSSTSLEHLHQRALDRYPRRTLAELFSKRARAAGNIYRPRDSGPLTQTTQGGALYTIGKSSGCTTFEGLFANTTVIQGFESPYEISILSELIGLDPIENWGPLFLLVLDFASKPSLEWSLKFLLGTIGFRNRSSSTHSAVQVLRKAATLRTLALVPIPKAPEFTDFQPRQLPSVEHFRPLLDECRVPCPPDPRLELLNLLDAKTLQKIRAEERKHEKKSLEELDEFVTNLFRQWRCERPSAPWLRDTDHFRTVDAWEIVTPEWQRLYWNSELQQHLDELSDALKREGVDFGSQVAPARRTLHANQKHWSQATGAAEAPQLSTEPAWAAGRETWFLRRIAALVNSVTEIANTSRRLRQQILAASRVVDPTNDAPMVAPELTCELKSLINSLRNGGNQTRIEYSDDLLASVASLETRSATNPATGRKLPDMADLQQAIQTSKELIKEVSRVFRAALAEDPALGWLDQANCGPPAALSDYLAWARHPMPQEIRSAVIDALMQLGSILVIHQQLVRLRAAKWDPNKMAIDELVATESSMATRHQVLDWLLFEIDADITIRPGQYEVAQAMISPQSNANSVLQLLMGEGKSSVVAPIVLAVLANTQNLVRVVVPKQLISQTAQTLQLRIGGLMNRTVKYMPFSRRSPTQLADIALYKLQHEDAMNTRGVILTTSEHILSFHLTGIQLLSDGKAEASAAVMEAEAWFKNRARDVLDESDSMLSIKTQLVYPSGAHELVQGQPRRWTLVQKVLRIVRAQAMIMAKIFPFKVRIGVRPHRSFPRITLLDRDIKRQLLERTVGCLLNGEAGVLPILDEQTGARSAARHFLTSAALKKNDQLAFDRAFGNNDVLKQTLFLIRGLLVYRILLTCLGKRFNVEYGLHPNRAPIAVPYQSKGVPSEESEYGYPDVAILLTILSFYYQGLSEMRFREAAKRLAKTESPAEQYAFWIEGVPMPENARSWNSVNLEDEVQLTNISALLRFQILLADYYMNQFVFPKYAKVFEQKIVCSGWDIPLLPRHIDDPNTLRRAPLTVGFSGTNDNKRNLPLTIRQDDLETLRHTSAEVLTYLLQPRNTRYIPLHHDPSGQISEPNFLKTLHWYELRVLIDAGALMLEHSNEDLARLWLTVDVTAKAAVYFSDDGLPCLLRRDGRVQSLAGSAYAERLDECVVYFDQSHTRGVDLKMPANTRAGLTLGVGQTKDHTVQAAMRLRKLATTQAVTFFASPEVHQLILNLRGRPLHYSPTSADVVAWLLEQTCQLIDNLRPLYASQGLDFYARSAASAAFSSHSPSDADIRRANFLTAVRTRDEFSVEALYGFHDRSKAPASRDIAAQHQAAVKKLLGIRNTTVDTGDATQALAHQEVEQEREVEIEVEIEREIKRGAPAQPAKPGPLSQELVAFVKSGRMPGEWRGLKNAFAVMGGSQIGTRYGVKDEWSELPLWCTDDFLRTIVTSYGRRMSDEYLRPVRWVVWAERSKCGVLVSEWEANALLPRLREEGVKASLLLYAPPVVKEMAAFDRLVVYALPSLGKDWEPPGWFKLALGIFAGGVWVEGKEREEGILRALGRAPAAGEDATEEMGTETENGSTEEKSLRQETENASEMVKAKGERNMPGRLSDHAARLVHEWMSNGRNGLDIAETPVGVLCASSGFG